MKLLGRSTHFSAQIFWTTEMKGFSLALFLLLVVLATLIHAKRDDNRGRGRGHGHHHHHHHCEPQPPCVCDEITTVEPNQSTEPTVQPQTSSDQPNTIPTDNSSSEENSSSHESHEHGPGGHEHGHGHNRHRHCPPPEPCICSTEGPQA